MNTGSARVASWFMILLILTALTVTGGCALFEITEGQAAPVEELDEQMVQANNNLGFNLMKKLATEEDDNVFISPSSILVALAMTYNGAEGDTKAAMEKTLGLEGMSMDEVNKVFADLLTLLHNPDPKVELTLANSLWAREGVGFDEEFIENNYEYFGAEVAELDFDQAEAADTINRWVEENTGGKIDSIVEPPISPETVLFLINAIYFKGEWSDKFDPDQTREIPFNLPDGSTKEHPVMFKYDDFSYLQNDLYQAARLPYGENERIGMYLFLPKEGIPVEDLYRKIETEPWKAISDKFFTMEGEIGLPRFGFEYETSLNNVLEALGMGIAFDQDLADFSGMRPIPPRLFISDVKHKSFVEVNEEGTEAAAVTSVEVGVTSMPETFSMIIDRPFFFVIADDMTGIILFMGMVVNP